MGKSHQHNTAPGKWDGDRCCFQQLLRSEARRGRLVLLAGHKERLYRERSVGQRQKLPCRLEMSRGYLQVYLLLGATQLPGHPGPQPHLQLWWKHRQGTSRYPHVGVGNQLWSPVPTPQVGLLLFSKASKMLFMMKQHLLLGQHPVIHHCWARAGLVHNRAAPPIAQTKRQITNSKPQPRDSYPSAQPVYAWLGPHRLEQGDELRDAAGILLQATCGWRVPSSEVPVWELPTPGCTRAASIPEPTARRRAKPPLSTATGQ